MSAAVMDTRQVSHVRKMARPALSDCLCGCGAKTRGRFAPGHDATLKRNLKATVEVGGPAGRAAKQALKAFGWS